VSESPKGSGLSVKRFLTGADILQRLERALTDHHLAAWFPELPPVKIREYLCNAALLRDSFEVHVVVPESLPQPSEQQVETREAVPGKLILYTDGASRGNPGEAGAGFVVSDGSGRELFAGGRYLGQCTNNMAEYQALLLGLLEVKRLQATEVAIFLDSELIVRQLQGRYRVKDEKLKPLYQQALQYLAGFSGWRVQHVPRAQNARADELSNQAIDERL